MVKSVLIADDHEFIRQALCHLFTSIYFPGGLCRMWRCGEWTGGRRNGSTSVSLRSSKCRRGPGAKGEDVLQATGKTPVVKHFANVGSPNSDRLSTQTWILRRTASRIKAWVAILTLART